MSNSAHRATQIAAPAKLNLGLEVLGRRADGLHELATIFLTVSLFDHLTVAQAETSRIVTDVPELAADVNLVSRALESLRPWLGDHGATVEVRKHIPIAAGLGGASSDAAAALFALRHVWGLPLSDSELAVIAAKLGSDVPFFVPGGCALGRGTGEQIEPLPLPTTSRFVVVTPAVVIPRKTATLYACLRPEDFSDGSHVESQAHRMRAGLSIDLANLENAFSRALYELIPSLADVPAIMRDAGAPSVALSGAGPTHYAVVDDPEAALAIVRRLRVRLGFQAQLFVLRPVPARSDIDEPGMM